MKKIETLVECLKSTPCNEIKNQLNILCSDDDFFTHNLNYFLANLSTLLLYITNNPLLTHEESQATCMTLCKHLFSKNSELIERLVVKENVIGIINELILNFSVKNRKIIENFIAILIDDFSEYYFSEIILSHLSAARMKLFIFIPDTHCERVACQLTDNPNNDIYPFHDDEVAVFNAINTIRDQQKRTTILTGLSTWLLDFAYRSNENADAQQTHHHLLEKICQNAFKQNHDDWLTICSIVIEDLISATYYSIDYFNNNTDDSLTATENANKNAICLDFKKDVLLTLCFYQDNRAGKARLQCLLDWMKKSDFTYHDIENLIQKELTPARPNKRYHFICDGTSSSEDDSEATSNKTQRIY